MLNQVTLLGRLTRDPELRRTGSGTAVVSFSLAVDRDYGDKATRETDFLNCVAWRNTAEAIAKYFAKGRLILVSGRIQVRPWVDKEGSKRQSTEILVNDFYFCDAKKAGGPEKSPAEPLPPDSSEDLPNLDDLANGLPF